MPDMEERGTGHPEVIQRKPRAKYIGRRALLELVLSRSPSTRKWIVDKLEKQTKVKDKAVRDIRLLAKSLGVKVTKLEVK